MNPREFVPAIVPPPPREGPARFHVERLGADAWVVRDRHQEDLVVHVALSRESALSYSDELDRQAARCETPDRAAVKHTHPCGHNCLCTWGNSQLCDRCEIADVMLRRHPVCGQTRGEAIACLYLALRMVVGDESL